MTVRKRGKMDNKKNYDLGLPISALCFYFNIHPRTLRIYDKEGILSPNRLENNRRHYSLNDVEKLRIILFLTRNLGVNLSGIKIIFSMLEKNKIPIKSYIKYLNEIAIQSNIDNIAQKNNIVKNAKKGRKANSYDKI